MRGVYGIVDPAVSPDVESVTAAFLRGGIRLVQYRCKTALDAALVRRLHTLVAAEGGVLIVNDDLEAALHADGLHVGQEDLQRIGSAVRAQLGRRILGISCDNADEARAAIALGADYLGVGPFAETRSKHDAGPAIGERGVRAVVQAAGDVPVAAIGGIGLDDIPHLVASGARMAAVLSALVRGDPEERARAFVARWNRSCA